MIYAPISNGWISGPQLYRGYDQTEASWVKLPDNSILTDDPFGTNSERYIPALNQWINDANIPVPLWYAEGEIGAALLLPNGKALFLGATGNTALYTPTGTTNMGSWQAGASIPDGQGAWDAPAAMMPNGKVLCMFSTVPTYGPPCTFFEYDPVVNSFTATGFPGNNSNLYPNDARMLVLPDRTILCSFNGFSSVYAYQPDGSPLAEGQPTIISISTNFYRSYHLTGTLLNGINEGAEYGDDAQMNSNYPLVRMTNNTTGNVYYARTYNWSSTGVMTGTNIVSTEFMVPENLPAGNYSLVVVANGISSKPVSFTFTPDPLSITLLMGLASSGPIGGPFNPAERAYFLSNTSTSPLNWSLAGTSTLLSATASSGTLVPGGQSTVIISVSPAATNLPAGIYTSTLWFTNLDTDAGQSIPFRLEVTPLIQNGGFETGSFGDWTVSGNVGNSYAASEPLNNNPSYSHSGNFSAWLGMNNTVGYLSQTIPTALGQSYLLSLFLDSPSGIGSSNEFAISWDGLTIFDQQGITTVGWTNLQFIVWATSDSTELEFSFDNATNYFRLDDVSLSNLPPTLSIASQPGNQVVPTGANAVFSVLASGPPPFTYQWQDNGTDLVDGGQISGSATANLSVSDAVVANSGSYTVVVSSGSQSVTSAVATLAVIGISPNCAVSAPTGLISWWTGNFTANDEVSTNNSTLENGATYAPGEVGYAFSFNGVDQYVSVPDNPAWGFGTNAFSIDLWANFSAVGGAPAFLANDDGGGSTYKWIFWLNGSTLQLHVNTPSGDATYIASYSFSPTVGEWYHIALTRNGSTFLFYVDGSLVSSNTSTVVIPTPDAPLTIGQAEGGFYFSGLLDEIQIYSRALSASEVQAIYQAGTNGMCAPTPLMFTGSPSYSKTNGVVLNASLRSGQSYSLQANTNLASTNWIALTNFMAGTAPVSHFTNLVGTNIPQQFYRIISP
jgi:hypothetical protein